MRIISLHPLATDILNFCGVGWDLVGMTHVCARPTNSTKAKIVTAGSNRPFRYLNHNFERLSAGLCEHSVDIEQIKDCVPSILLADVRDPDSAVFIPWAEELLFEQIGVRVTIKPLRTDNLEDVYHTMQEVGGLLGKESLVTKLVEDIQSHLHTWSQDYAHACKGKKVLLLSEVEPFGVESGWIDDIIGLFGAQTFSKLHAHHTIPIAWKDIVEGRPDVIVVAPHNCSYQQSVRRLHALASSEGWEDLPAVQRGQVFFTAGLDLYRPGPNFLKGIATFIAAMAGVQKPLLKDQEDIFKIKAGDGQAFRLLD